MLLADFITDLDWDQLPETTRQAVRFSLLDAIGCAISGNQSDSSKKLTEHIRKHFGAGSSSVWGTAGTVPFDWSVYLNAHGAAYYDMDDGHRRAQGHPGATIVPAAFAAAIQLGRSGRELLEALVVGYEVAIRSALVMRQLGGPRKGSGGWGVTGAAAAVARLFRLKQPQLINAVGLAEYYAPQAPQDRSAFFPSEMKEGIPWGAYTGYNAARLAAAGLTSMRPFLADSEYSNDLGEIYEIENCYFKRYASCRWAHPALDGLGLMLSDRRCDWRKIREVRVRTFEKAALMDRLEPANTMEAVYSIPFALASYLVHGQLGPRQVEGKALKDPEITNLSRRVKLMVAPELTAGFPEFCQQQLEVEFVDETVYQSPLLSAKGDPSNPYSSAELVDKFRWLSERIIGDRWQQIVSLVKVFEQKETAQLKDLMST